MARFLFLLVFVCVGITVAWQDSSQEHQTLENNQDFDLRGDARVLFEGVAKAYGFDCTFDPDYDPGKSIPFHLQGTDYRTALHALEEATRSFVIPLSEKRFLVANDSPEKRRSLEPYVAVTVEIPPAVTPQEVTELVTGIQQVMAIEKLGVQTQGNRVVLRGPVSKIVPAQMMIEGLTHAHPEVSIELQLIEINRSDMVAYGLDLPTVIPIVNLNSLTNAGTSLATIGKGVIGGFGAGIAIASAQLLAQMAHSSGRSLLDLDIRASNRQPVTFHSGDRYPVVTSEYVSGTSASSSSTANGANSFAAPNVFGNVPGASALVFADLNGDGIPDIAAASTGSDSAAVLFGKGDGTFGDATFFAAGKAPAAIAAVDVNGDQILDLVTADAGSNTVSILLGKGDGTFAKALQFAVGTHPAALVIADFNRDGIPDIATANTGSNDVSILLGMGDGTFTAAQSLPAGSGPRSLVAIDLNGDRKLDLAVANSASNDVSILLGSGDGTFAAAVSYPAGKSRLPRLPPTM